VHINGGDISNDLRPFLKYLAQPFSSKLRSKEAKGLKSINFLLDSILLLCSMVNFYLNVAQNWGLSFFEPEKVATRQGFELPAALETFSVLKRTNLNFSLLVGGNWPKYIKTKWNLIKSLYLRKIFVFPNFHFVTPWPPLTSIYLKKAEPNISKMVSNHSIYHPRWYALHSLCFISNTVLETLVSPFQFCTVVS